MSCSVEQMQNEINVLKSQIEAVTAQFHKLNGAKEILEKLIQEIKDKEQEKAVCNKTQESIDDYSDRPIIPCFHE